MSEAAPKTVTVREALQAEGLAVREQGGRWFLVAMTSLVASLVLVGVLTMKSLDSGIRYVRVDREGRIVPIAPLEHPLLSESDLLDWASRAVRAAWNISFVNTPADLAQAKLYFSTAGWRGYYKALLDSKLIDSIKTNRLVVNAIVTEPPVVTRSGVGKDGAWRWVIEIPLQVSYVGPNTQKVERYLAVATVVRDNHANEGVLLDALVSKK